MTTSVVMRLLKRSKRVGDCLEWQGCKARNGYGLISVKCADGKHRNKGTHRVAWEALNGPIPVDKVIDHLCHNPACFRVQHLRLVTRKQNNEHKKGASANSKSGVRGVCWGARQKKWKAAVRHNGKLYHAGYFDDLEEAGEAAKQLRLKLFTHSTVDLT